MSVLILDDKAYVRYRIRDLLESKRIEAFDTANSIDFFNILAEKKDEIEAIILEVGLNKEDGFEIIKKIKSKDNNIPIMIVTSLNTRNAFIKGVKAGAVEYILKPFDNKFLLERIDSLITRYKTAEKKEEKVEKKPKPQTNNIRAVMEKMPSDFNNYLEKQIEIAKAQGMEVSVFMLNLARTGGGKAKVELKETYFLLSDHLFIKLKNLFDKDQLFVKYGIFSFLGVLPNFNENQTQFLWNSMQKEFNLLKSRDSKYTNYKLNGAFVSFPHNGQTNIEIINNLVLKMKSI